MNRIPPARNPCQTVLILIIFLSLVGLPRFYAAEMRHLTRGELLDKIRGGWAGQMIGVSYGAPTEFRSNGKINETELKWSPERVSNAIEQDDLYVEMTFAKVMDDLGLDATCAQYGEAFKNSKYHLWHANAGARRALGQGVQAPWSGDPKYNFHANDIDFQIEADFIGLMCPGLPRVSNHYSDRVGRVMNYPMTGGRSGSCSKTSGTRMTPALTARSAHSISTPSSMALTSPSACCSEIWTL